MENIVFLTLFIHVYFTLTHTHRRHRRRRSPKKKIMILSPCAPLSLLSKDIKHRNDNAHKKDVFYSKEEKKLNKLKKKE